MPAGNPIADSLLGAGTPTNAFFGQFGSAISKNPGIIVAQIVNIVLGFIGITFVVLVTYAGFMYLTAGGEEDKTKKALLLLSQAVIGLIITLAAWSISYFIVISISGAVTGPVPTGG
ncbi:MAG: hypothetical protein AAB416_00555 [Patescibacteria group bacterium]